MGDAHHCSAPPPRLRNDLYCVEWDVKTLVYHTIPAWASVMLCAVYFQRCHATTCTRFSRMWEPCVPSTTYRTRWSHFRRLLPT